MFDRSFISQNENVEQNAKQLIDRNSIKKRQRKNIHYLRE